MLKFPRTIRLDPSDTFVFERAAEPGEWAVSGAFVFWNRDPADARPEAARGVALGLSWHRQSRLVDARDRHRGDGSGAASHGRAPRQRSCWRNSARPIAKPRALPPKKRSRLRPRCAITRRRPCSPCSAASRTAKSASAFAPSAARSRGGCRSVARACQRLYLSRGRRRGRADRGGRSAGLDQDRSHDEGSHMREFWVASGHHLTRRGDHGGLVVTPELIMAYLARPELMPPADACDAERELHASLLADPLRPVSRRISPPSPTPMRAKTGPSW